MAKKKTTPKKQTTTASPKKSTTRVIKGDTTNFSVLKSGAQVPTRKIDSIKKANPTLGKAIGKASKDKYGNNWYGDVASDAIKSGLKGKK